MIIKMACGNVDLVTDALIEPSTLPCEHYDAAIAYSVDYDFEKAQQYMELMNSLTLDNGMKPKVCLHTNPQFSDSCVEKPNDVIKYCTFVFCLLTKNFPHDLSAKLFKEEAIGLTRLAVNGEEGCPGIKDRKYCVRPLHSQLPNQRGYNYKVPMGLTTIQGFNMINEEQSKTLLKQLFNHYINLRLQREKRSKMVLIRSEIDKKKSMITPSIGTLSTNSSCCEDVSILHCATLGTKDSECGLVAIEIKNDLPSLMQDSAYGSATNDLMVEERDSGTGTISFTHSDKTCSFNFSNNSVDSFQNLDTMVPVIPSYETSEQIDDTDLSIDRNQKSESVGDGCLITKTEEISKDKGSLPIESRDNSETVHKLEYTSGIYSSAMLKDENIYIPHVVGSEVPRKDIFPKPPDAHSGSSTQEIRFVNCSNIQIGDAGTWTMPNPVTVYKGSGNTTEVIHEDSSDSDSEDEPYIHSAGHSINGINEIEEFTKQRNSEYENDFIDIRKDTNNLSETMQRDSENFGTIQNNLNHIILSETIPNRDDKNFGKMQNNLSESSENITDVCRTESTSELSEPSKDIEEFTKYTDQWNGENNGEDRLSLSSMESPDDDNSVEQKEVKKGDQKLSKINSASIDVSTMNSRPEKHSFIGTAQLLGLVPDNHQSYISMAEEVD